MNFRNGMTCEIIISNGIFTVGYVNGKPAEWVGNNEPLTDGVQNHKAWAAQTNVAAQKILSVYLISKGGTVQCLKLLWKQVRTLI